MKRLQYLVALGGAVVALLTSASPVNAQEGCNSICVSCGSSYYATVGAPWNDKVALPWPQCIWMSSCAALTDCDGGGDDGAEFDRSWLDDMVSVLDNGDTRAVQAALLESDGTRLRLNPSRGSVIILGCSGYPIANIPVTAEIYALAAVSNLRDIAAADDQD